MRPKRTLHLCIIGLQKRPTIYLNNCQSTGMENVPREILTGKSEGLKGELSPHMRCRIE